MSGQFTIGYVAKQWDRIIGCYVVFGVRRVVSFTFIHTFAVVTDKLYYDIYHGMRCLLWKCINSVFVWK